MGSLDLYSIKKTDYSSILDSLPKKKTCYKCGETYYENLMHICKPKKKTCFTCWETYYDCELHVCKPEKKTCLLCGETYEVSRGVAFSYIPFHVCKPKKITCVLCGETYEHRYGSYLDNHVCKKKHCDACGTDYYRQHFCFEKFSRPSPSVGSKYTIVDANDSTAEFRRRSSFDAANPTALHKLDTAFKHDLNLYGTSYNTVKLYDEGIRYRSGSFSELGIEIGTHVGKLIFDTALESRMCSAMHVSSLSGLSCVRGSLSSNLANNCLLYTSDAADE